MRKFALDPLGIDGPTCITQQGRNPAVAIAAILAGQGDDVGGQCLFIIPTHSEHLYGEFWHRAFTVCADTANTRYIVSFGANVEVTGGVCAVRRHADAPKPPA